MVSSQDPHPQTEQLKMWYDSRNMFEKTDMLLSATWQICIMPEGLDTRSECVKDCYKIHALSWCVSKPSRKTSQETPSSFHRSSQVAELKLIVKGKDLMTSSSRTLTCYSCEVQNTGLLRTLPTVVQSLNSLHQVTRNPSKGKSWNIG
jgi:hypothetical protein